MKHTLSSICQSIPGNRPYKYRQFFSEIKKNLRHACGVLPRLSLFAVRIYINTGIFNHPFRPFQKNFRPEVKNCFFVKGVRLIVFTFMLTVGLYVMAKQNTMTVKDLSVRTLNKNGIDYICITDIARQKNAVEPKDVVKNWMRQKNTLEYLGLWERLNNPSFKGGRIRPPFE